MPYRELIMIDIKEVLRRWCGGAERAPDRARDRRRSQDGRQVLRGRSKLPLPRDREPTDDGVHADRAVRAGAPDARRRATSGRRSRAHRARIERWLAQTLGR